MQEVHLSFTAALFPSLSLFLHFMIRNIDIYARYRALDLFSLFLHLIMRSANCSWFQIFTVIALVPMGGDFSLSYDDS